METILFCAVIVMLLKIAYLDYRYHYIADLDILLGTIPALALQTLRHTWFNGLVGLILGGACASLVYFFAKWKYDYAAFGSGDVTLFLFLGSIVGEQGFGEWAVFFSLLFLLCLVPLHLAKKLSWAKAFPLAPFLNLATLFWLCSRLILGRL
jgi:prepilin signal peptidase PulO-like enzyme (type II secretory pathway)